MYRFILLYVLICVIFSPVLCSAQISPKQAQRLLEERAALHRGYPVDDEGRKSAYQRTSDVLLFPIGSIEPPLADELKLVMDRAVSAGYKTLVLDIESSGGQVFEANRIVKVLTGQKDLEVVSYIRSAISAAIWPVLASDIVYMQKGSTVGGAQIYSVNQTTGNFLVDEKFNSIEEAKLRALAQRNNHPVDFAMSMIVPKSTGEKMRKSVIVWLDPYKYAKQTIEVEKKRVATYTAQESLAAGFTKQIVDDLSVLYPKTDAVNYELIHGIMMANYVLTLMENKVYKVYYPPNIIAERTRRKTVQVEHWKTSWMHPDSSVRYSQRMQTDAEYKLYQNKVRIRASRAVSRCIDLRKKIQSFCNRSDLPLFALNDKQSRMKTIMFARMIDQGIRRVEQDVDNFSEQMVDLHYQSFKSLLSKAREDIQRVYNARP